MFTKNWIAARANILCKYLKYICIFYFGRGFFDFISMFLLQAPASCGKEILK